MIINSALACVYFAKNGRMITPGNNIIPDAEAKAILETPHAIGLLKAKKLSVVHVDKETAEKQAKSKGTKASKEGTSSLSRQEAIDLAVKELMEDYDVENACIIVDQTLDMQLLKAMKDGETRTGVLNKIDKQIKFVTAEPEEDE